MIAYLFKGSSYKTIHMDSLSLMYMLPGVQGLILPA